jgi:hypothetical protein
MLFDLIKAPDLLAAQLYNIDAEPTTLSISAVA